MKIASKSQMVLPVLLLRESNACIARIRIFMLVHCSLIAIVLLETSVLKMFGTISTFGVTDPGNQDIR